MENSRWLDPQLAVSGQINAGTQPGCVCLGIGNTAQAIEAFLCAYYRLGWLRAACGYHQCAQQSRKKPTKSFYLSHAHLRQLTK
jgi:hypothetical protein